MQADALLPQQQRRKYRGAADALLRIAREEGVQGLYRGVGPNVCRAMALNMGMLASNEQVISFLARLSPSASSFLGRLVPIQCQEATLDLKYELSRRSGSGYWKQEWALRQVC